MPFFSVVIALYNKENYVADALHSIFSQTFGDFEVIVVNDGSTDRSADIARSFPDARLKIIDHASNKGLNAARNTGIASALSQNIAFLDADDVWKPFFLQKIADLMERFPEAGLYATNYAEEYPNGRILPIVHNVALRQGESGIVADYYAAALAQPILWYGSAVVRKRVFETAGLFDENITLWEDVDFNIRANLNEKMAFCNEVCAIYRVFTENQIMNSPVAGKRLPDFDKYEKFALDRPSVKRYLDTNRYILSVRYRLSSDWETANTLKKAIAPESLTASQNFLLSAPAWLVRTLRRAKLALVKNGIRLTTFRRSAP